MAEVTVQKCKSESTSRGWEHTQEQYRARNTNYFLNNIYMSKTKVIPVTNTPGVKKVEMLFYNTAPSKENTGLKFVLWEIVEVLDVPVVQYDWGFANWSGDAFDAIEVPEGYTARVMRWANTIDPAVLLEEKKIISI